MTTVSKIKTNLDKIGEFTTNLLKKLPNDNWVAQSINTFFVFIASFIPIYFFGFLRWLFEPITFWQNLTLFVVWGILLGWVQIVFWIVATVIIIVLWEKR